MTDLTSKEDVIVNDNNNNSDEDDKVEKNDDKPKDELEEQLKWRLCEGQGEFIYEIGVSEDGTLLGLPKDKLEDNIKKVTDAAKSLNAEVSVLTMRKGKEGDIADLLIREVREDKYFDIRIAVCGNVDSGKSTMIGVLSSGKLDNGRGLVRVNLFQHKHEATTGRTSSINQQIVGFNVKGECVNELLDDHHMTWGDIIEQSYKVVSFFDLAGHEKYLKTTVSGLTGQMPDYAFLLIGANMGITKMTKEHLGLALALKIPVIVVITKIDLAPENILKQNIEEIQRILKMRGIRKMNLVIRNEEDLMTAIKTIGNDRIVPIFLISNVKGTNLDLVKKFLNAVPPRIQWDVLISHPAEVLIDQTYFVTGVGTVVAGTMMAGEVTAGQNLLLGPDGNGQFQTVNIKTIHCKRVPTKKVVAGQSASFALKKIKRSTIRKGMVLIDTSLPAFSTWYFEADVIILYHATTIHENYQPVVQCMTMRQSAKIIKILEKGVLRTGDRAIVRFKFMYRPEYLKIGMRVIFREGHCKGIGIISKVSDVEHEEEKTTKDDQKKTH